MIPEIIILGVLCACACALPGNFLVLRRMSMMGDAISHAVLPGIVIAYLVLGSRSSIPMLVGAVLAGVFTTFLTELLHRKAKVEESTSMGVVFTTLFALGIFLVTKEAGHVDLDVDCVLYGSLEVLAYDLYSGTFFILVGVLIINALFIALFFKELKLTSFDEQLADTLGFSSQLMHHLLMGLVAITTVAAFEAVGSILVIAMLVVPPATARLFTDRLSTQILLSLLIASGCAIIGHAAAIYLPQLLGFSDTITSGMMATTAGVIYLAALLFAPRYGTLSKARHRKNMNRKLVREDVLGLMYRAQENGQPAAAAWLSDSLMLPEPQLSMALAELRKTEQIEGEEAALTLLPAGLEAGRKLIQSHRLWESYIHKHFELPIDHLHASAEQLEHVTDAPMLERLRDEVDDPELDPMGKAIPNTEASKPNTKPPSS